MKRIGIGVSDFKKIIEEEFYYFDKTSFIDEIIQDGAEVKLFTRPRRFGKTLNMSMLKYFFDIKEAEENRKLFKGLYIEKTESYKEQGQYPVIFLSLKDLKASTWEEMKKDIKSSFVQIGPGNVVEKLWNQIIEENHSEQSSIKYDCEDNNNFENIVEDWNRLYKIGTKIRVNGLSRIQKTRSEAVMLFDTKPIIYLEGYKGYFEVKDIIEVIDDVH